MNRTKFWLALFVAVVFSAGAAAGLLLQPMLLPPPPAAVDDARPSPRFLMRRLAEDLELTPEQQKQFEDAVNARRRRLDATREEVRVRFENDASGLVDDIQHILTPDQRRRFESFVARVRARYRTEAPSNPPRP
jgi:Spy/CpxP family protein refolding chaperone